MDRDRNLLFGVLAVQLRRVTPQQLVEAALVWSADPAQPLGARLVETGALQEADRALIDDFVERAIQAGGGDASQALASFGGEAQVYETFQGSLFMNPSGGVTMAKEISPAPQEDDETISAVHEVPGRYQREREYARGGMGRVLLVHDEHLGREIALKELLPVPGATFDPDTPHSPVRKTLPLVARFLQEARITGQLEHPSIVPVYEVGHRKDGSLYYTMKLVRGKTLSEAIKEADTLEKRLLLLPHFVDLCNAIAYAHSRKVIHRDLKPGNIMVGEFGETVVLDWGLAKYQGREETGVDPLAETLRAVQLEETPQSAKTSYGQALGTPAYMPPEQARGELDRVDHRSDVYSLGAVLYQILTGRPPFTGNSALEIMEKVEKEEPLPIRKVVKGVRKELNAICIKAMEKDPDHRFPSAKALADDMQKFLADSPVWAYEYSLIERGIRYFGKHKGISTVVVAAVFLVGAIAQVYTQRTYKAEMERQNFSAKIAVKEQTESDSIREIVYAWSSKDETRNAIDHDVASLCVDIQIPENPSFLMKQLSLRGGDELKHEIAEFSETLLKELEKSGRFHGFARSRDSLSTGQEGDYVLSVSFADRFDSNTGFYVEMELSTACAPVTLVKTQRAFPERFEQDNEKKRLFMAIALASDLARALPSLFGQVVKVEESGDVLVDFTLARELPIKGSYAVLYGAPEIIPTRGVYHAPSWIDYPLVLSRMRVYDTDVSLDAVRPHSEPAEDSPPNPHDRTLARLRADDCSGLTPEDRERLLSYVRPGMLVQIK